MQARIFILITTIIAATSFLAANDRKIVIPRLDMRQMPTLIRTYSSRTETLRRLQNKDATREQRAKQLPELRAKIAADRKRLATLMPANGNNAQTLDLMYARLEQLVRSMARTHQSL